MTLDLLDLRTSTPALLATCEAIVPYMNGPRAARLANALDDLALDELEVRHPDDEPRARGDYLDPDDRQWLSETLEAIPRERLGYWTEELVRLQLSGVEVVRCSEAAYPLNLRMIHNRPPILFVRGEIRESDKKSVAIVGARAASDEGCKLAFDLAHGLASRGVTIVSGLARGIDTAAHTGALEAHGRTIAVFGTAIDKVYPKENSQLARLVEEGGACISQFLPNQRVGPWAFPLRNIVTSGLSIGSVVVEASESSGARHQANAALAHGKSVYLVDKLVTSQPWAREMAERADAFVVSNLTEVIDAVSREVTHDTHVLL